jgi:hypothetical protein
MDSLSDNLDPKHKKIRIYIEYSSYNASGWWPCVDRDWATYDASSKDLRNVGSTACMHTVPSHETGCIIKIPEIWIDIKFRSRTNQYIELLIGNILERRHEYYIFSLNHGTHRLKILLE